MLYFDNLHVSSVVKHIAIGAGDLGFGPSIANCSPPVMCFFGAVLSQALSRGDGFRHSIHMFRRHTASVIKM